MKKLWVFGALGIAVLTAALVIISMRSAQMDVHAVVTGTESKLAQRALLSGTPPPRRAGEWQCWDDGALDPCHRNLVDIQALSDNDIWIAAGGYNSKGILHYDGSEWQEMNIPATGVFGYDLQALKMLSSNYGWAVSNSNVPWRWDGTTWRSMEIVHNWDWLGLQELDIVSSDDVWVVGSGRQPGWVNVGAIVHWDGQSWMTVTVSNTLNGVSMVSANNGWAVGAGGSIYQWDSTAWISATSPVTSDLYNVASFGGDPNNAWAVGENGIILHYDGSEWSVVSSPVTESLRSIAMTSATHGWIVGEAGTILRFDGADWVVATSPTDANLASVTAISTDSAYAVSTEGGLIHWNGNVWETLFEVPERRGLMDVVMVAPHDGWAAGEGGRLDHWNGSNWNPVDSHTGETLEALDFLATYDGWAVGGGGTILHYNGSDWIPVSSPTNDRLRGVDVISSTEGWAAGDNGTILRYNGTMWITFTSPTTFTLQEVRMVSAEEGWAVGGGFSGNWDIGYRDVILHWNGTAWEYGAPPDSLGGFFSSLSIVAPNGVYATNILGLYHWDGTSWSETEDPQVGQAYGIDIYNADEGWVTAWNGAISHWDGQRWEMVFNRTHTIAAVDAIAPHEAWAVCGEWSGGGILHYTAPVPVRGTLAPGESLVHSYTGHETRITLGPGAGDFSDTFSVSYKFRPNDQGDLRGIDHFFEIIADQLNLSVPLTVTIRFSDTQEFGVFPGTTKLYRLGSSGWVTAGITIVNTQADGLEAEVTQLGSFGVMGHGGYRVFMPIVLRNH